MTTSAKRFGEWRLSMKMSREAMAHLLECDKHEVDAFEIHLWESGYGVPLWEMRERIRGLSRPWTEGSVDSGGWLR